MEKAVVMAEEMLAEVETTTISNLQVLFHYK